VMAGLNAVAHTDLARWRFEPCGINRGCTSNARRTGVLRRPGASGIRIGSVSVTPTAIEVISRAVIRRGRSVLLVKAQGDDWWFLPGGHVEPGERSADALARELGEELGAHVRVSGDPVAIAENFYDDKDGPHHEINVVFIVVDPGGSLMSMEPHLESAWVPGDELAQIEIRPPAVWDILRTHLT